MSARLGLPRQRLEMQRNRDEHPLAEVADARHEDRPPRQTGILRAIPEYACARAKPVKLERRRRPGFVGFDHAAAAAGIPRDGVDGDGVVGGDDAGFDKRPEERDGARRVAAGIGDAIGGL